MSPTTVLIFAVSIGIVCGLRSMTGPAIVCWGAHLGWLQLGHTRLAFLHSIISLVLFTLFALAELVADKLPKTPARTQVGPLVVRFISGALCGSALCLSAGASVLAGALLGGIFAAVGAFLGYYVRHWLTAEGGLPDLPVALVEDLITICLGVFVVSRFVMPAALQKFY